MLLEARFVLINGSDCGCIVTLSRTNALCSSSGRSRWQSARGAKDLEQTVWERASPDIELSFMHIKWAPMLAMKHWVFLALVLGAALQLLGAYLFSKGFMLTRVELQDASTCELPRVDGDRDAELWGPMEQLSGGCWTKRAVDRVVLLVVDALRHDMVFPPKGDASLQVTDYALLDRRNYEFKND